MSILVELTEEQSQQLEKLADTLRVGAQELVQAAVTNLLNQPADDFERVATYVLTKNRELYKRLRG